MFRIVNISGNEDFAKEIFSLEKVCFTEEFWSYESICKSIKNPNNICLVCIYEDNVVGYITASWILDEAELERIAVSPEYRCKGIGQTLINELINILRKCNVIKLMLEVRTKNIAAISLYKQSGFTSDTIRKNYYTNPSDDALLMSLII